MARKPNKIFATQIGTLVPAITKASFERYGFAYADLAGKWNAILGRPLCEQCSPRKIVWPRGSKHDNERIGGTLHISCLSAFALDVQHNRLDIIERINRFYGYEAICELSIFQTSHLPENKDEQSERPDLTQAQAETLRHRVAEISDPDLSKTMEDLGGEILREKGKK